MTRARIDGVPNPARNLGPESGPGGASLRAYLRIETGLSIAINMVLSLVFFLIMFGLAPSIPVAGIGGYAFDFLPQSFMIALMSTLMPGIITAGRIRGGHIRGAHIRGAPVAGDAQSVGALIRRSVLAAAGALLIGFVIAAVLLAVATGAMLPWGWALAAKLLYDGLLAAIVTPIGLRGALRATDFR